MKTIPIINKGKKFSILVDSDDYEKLSKKKWFLLNGKYASRKELVGGKYQQVSMSRIITNCPKNMVVDHINGNTLDNRKKNLRVCTVKQNQMNRKPSNGSKSKYKGVHWYTAGKKWVASLCFHGEQITCGYFTDEIKAAKKYDQYASAIFGDYAYLNFPKDLNKSEELSIKRSVKDRFLKKAKKLVCVAEQLK